MTVQELMVELGQMPADMPVCTPVQHLLMETAHVEITNDDDPPVVVIW